MPALNIADAAALRKLQQLYGPLTIDQALEQAIEYETIASHMPSGDPARNRFTMEARYLQSLALLTEKAT